MAVEDQCRCETVELTGPNGRIIVNATDVDEYLARGFQRPGKAPEAPEKPDTAAPPKPTETPPATGRKTRNT